MSTKTKLFGAGAVAILVAVAVVLITRGDDSGSSEKVAPVETAEPQSLPTGVPAAPERPADAGPAVQLLPDGGPAPVASAPLKSTRFPQPPDPARYRPARFLIYSDDDVSLNKSNDNRNWALNRIIEVVQATPAQANQIRDLWRVHEDGRRELYEHAMERASGPRLLPQEAVHRLDAAFEADLLGKVLDTEQAQRMLEEVPPAGTLLPPKIATFQ